MTFYKKFAIIVVYSFLYLIKEELKYELQGGAAEVTVKWPVCCETKLSIQTYANYGRMYYRRNREKILLYQKHRRNFLNAVKKAQEAIDKKAVKEAESVRKVSSSKSGGLVTL